MVQSLCLLVHSLLIREIESLKISNINNNIKNSNNSGNNFDRSNSSAEKIKTRDGIDKTEKEENWSFCYNGVLTLVKPAFSKLLRGATTVGNVLTGEIKWRFF